MHKNATPTAYLVLFSIIITFFLPTQFIQPQPVLTYQPVISGLSSPIDIVNAGDGTDRLFVVQQGGAIRVYSPAYAFLGTLVTVAGISTGGERGLLSPAFHPNYETNRYFYVYYTTTDGSNTTYINVARYQTRADNPNLADDTSRKVLLTIAKPTGAGFTNHNGGRLQFGPDGMLYFATGDGGSGGDPFNNAQNGNSLLGKMIRLNVNVSPENAYVAPYYTIPADNPYVGDPAVRDEIFALGLRNPFRWSFDRTTGDMWIGDVGQDAREEINFRAAGPPSPGNYGWRCYEGTAPYNTSGCGPANTYISPIYEYVNPPAGAAAVTGGQVYRGTQFPAMVGYYVAADVYSGTHYVIRRISGNNFSVTTQAGPGSIVAFGESEDGEVYAVNLGGSISQLTTTTGLPARLVNFNALRKDDHIEVSWKTAYEYDLKNYEVEYSLDGRTYQLLQSVSAANNLNGATYTVRHILAFRGVVYYRLKINNADGTLQYSPVITTSWDRQLNGAYIPGNVRNNRLLLTLYEPFTSLRVLTPLGQVMFNRNIEGMTGFNEITLPSLPAGTYIVNISGRDRQYSTKIVIIR